MGVWCVRVCDRYRVPFFPWQCRGINDAACRLAREVAEEGDGLVAGGLSQTPTYLSGMSKADTQKEFQKQVDVFVENKVDFLIAEYFEHVEEMEWAIETCLKSGLPVVASMCIGPEGDLHGITVEECAVRMAKAGAHVGKSGVGFLPSVAIRRISGGGR
uniref:Hcy-binding domain-containing protein n=1 Tax=Scylla olivacea TaxID=85551 RepID=A0A0P4WEI3_SCYOL